MQDIQLRKASPKDAFLLSELTWHSKKHWGYPDEWMESWRQDLEITEEMLKNFDSLVIEVAGTIEGFVLISEEAGVFEIEHCFVNPEAIGKGYGKQLLTNILSAPQYQGQLFKVVADPNAIPFYEKFGFKTTHQIPSKPEGRFLPVMERQV